MSTTHSTIIYRPFVVLLFMMIIIISSPQHLEGQTLDCAIDAPTHQFDAYSLATSVYIPINYNTKFKFLLPWNRGTIAFEDGGVLRDIMLRYDRVDDILIWMRDKDYKTGMIEKSSVKSFTLNDKDTNQPYFFERCDNVIFGLKQTYLQVLCKGDVSIYVSRRLMESSNSTEYIVNDKYFTMYDNAFHSFTIRRFNFLNNMGIYRKKMRSIIRKNNIKIRNNEAGLIEATRLFNLEHEMK